MTTATQTDRSPSPEYTRRLESRLQALEQENRILRSVLEALALAPDTESGRVGVLTALPTGLCIHANDWVMQRTADAGDFNLMGSWLELVDVTDRRRVASCWESAVEQRRPFEVEFKLCASCYVRAIGAPDPASETLRFEIVLVDIDGLEQLRRHNEEAGAALAESREELRQVAYVTSHDLNEPLRMVTSYSQLLVRRYAEQIGEDGNEYVAYITGAVERMKSLLQDLVSYSRTLSAEMRAAPFHTGASLQWALMNLHGALQASGGKVDAGELPVCCGDQDRLVQVFEHLIANALKFRSAEPPIVRVEAEREGDHWRFAIKDNGIGIEPQFHDRIFGLFKRLHGKDVPGTGIGLTICKRIILDQGGTIWLESEPGAGSTFFFTLPAV